MVIRYDNKPSSSGFEGKEIAMTDKKYSLRKQAIGELRAERYMNQWTQEELAEKVGTQKSNISRIESGKQNLTLDYIQALAEAMNKEPALVLREPVVLYGGETDYILKLYDDELIRFKMYRDKYQLGIEILEVNEAMRPLFPLELDVSPEGLFYWMSKRTIPKNRELVGNIIQSLGVGINDIKGMIDICLGLSLNDSYWIVPVSFEGSFSDYNLYENPFSKALELVAYVGYGKPDRGVLTTPELTTGGMLRKAWTNKEDKGIWLYKSGTSGFANAGNEPFSEFYASQVAEKMGLNAVIYELENWRHILASKCRLFTDIDTSYIPIGRIVKEGGIDACIDFYKKLGDKFYQELASMLVFDAVIVNEDRHYGNFGVLRDNHTGEIIAPAPIFDNGISLLCYGMKDDFEESFERYLESRSNPYGDFNEFMPLAKKVMGKTQKDQLRKLINFRFTESDLVNLPGWRLRALEEMIQERVRELLK